LLSAAIPVWGAEQARQPLTLFAASSLTDVMQELTAAYRKSSGVSVRSSFAASSALARQIESGARADVFFSADTEWMDYLETRKLLADGSRRNVVGNALVLIAPADSKVSLKIAPNFALAAALGTRRLATGDPQSVPVGKYARAALRKLGVWDSVASKVVGAENVRAALAYVSRGEAPLGIVYATDAKIDGKVRVVDTFPADSHPPIMYPAAATAVSQPGAAPFLDFLRSAAASEIFAKYGFFPLQ
jgi:molybdate transport system substrate-binding protein